MRIDRSGQGFWVRTPAAMCTEGLYPAVCGPCYYVRRLGFLGFVSRLDILMNAEVLLPIGIHWNYFDINI